MDIVILLGAPGSGKGTIASRLAETNANLKHVSSGDLLRGAVAKGTAAGVEAKGYMEKGQLVPDALIAQMIKDVIAETEGDVTMLLDGFPRNVAQAEILAETGAPVRSVVLVHVRRAALSRAGESRNDQKFHTSTSSWSPLGGAYQFSWGPSMLLMVIRLP